MHWILALLLGLVIGGFAAGLFCLYTYGKEQEKTLELAKNALDDGNKMFGLLCDLRDGYHRIFKQSLQSHGVQETPELRAAIEETFCTSPRALRGNASPSTKVATRS